MNNLTGQIVKTYQVTGEIDTGGFGAVYRAFQPIIEREVALKVILPQFANKPAFIHRFEIEAQTVARLEHPYIVPLYDFWRDPNGAYLVMRYMRGGNLRQHLSDGAFALSRVLKYAEQIGAALDMAHRHNVIHRDIKPENILLDQDDNAYLTDFGIAQRDDTEQDIDSIAGSVNYMAPELIEGATPTPASDQYSLAIMLYELLTGELPFKANSAAEMLMHHLNDTLPDIRGVVSHMPMSLDPVLSRATSKNPSERYDSIQDFLQAFQEVQGDTDANTLNTTREMYALAENPYKGLRPFDESDAQDFFGRTRLTDQIITRLDEDTAYANFLAVVGPSGSGKSSVVRAGLMPRMRYGDVADTYDWFMADFVPGDNPIDALANALLKVAPSPLPQLRQNLQQDANALLDASMTILQQARGAKLFVFIDQFEELFTLTHNDAIRAHFLEMMRTTVMQTSDVYIVVTVRADFFDKPLMYEGIAEMMQSRTQVVLPLTARELERAIVAPAERVGIIVEPELVAAIVADVREEPGTLPLLQYSLTELFERRDNNKMTFQSYVSVGGVLSSLARRAEEVYEHLSPHQQDTAKQLFLRLVTLGEGTEDTRRRVRRQELFNIQQDRETVEATLDAFGNHRLLTFDRDTSTREPTVEIAHEALINRWYTLQTWLDDSRSDVRLQRSLASAAQEWDEKGRQIGFLLYGGRLIQYSEWAEESSVALTGLESAYLSASITEKEKRDQAEQERAEREQRLQQRVLQRTRIFAGAVSVAVLIAIGLATISFQLSQVAQDERDNAERAQLTSDANARTAEQQLEEIQNFNLVNQAQQAIQNGDSGFALSILNFVNHDALAPIVQRNVYDIAYTSQVRDRILGHTRTVTAL
ncbi:MAG: serine/threonine-protein kinase, partial [Chloroflexota bacterium]